MGKAVIFVFFAHTYLYFSHRFLLHGPLWKQHSIHHAHVWLRMHPIEHFLNWFTFPLGYFVGFSFMEMVPLLIWGVAFTFMAHKRKWPRLFRLPKSWYQFVVSVDAHHLHHKSTINYGVFFTFWDKLCRTEQ